MADHEAPQVFLSYSHNDQAAADWFLRELQERRLTVWIDRDGIRSGERFHRSIEQAVRESRAVVVLLSAKSAESTWVDAEWQQALTEKRLVIPVVLEDCSVPRVLLTRQVIRADSDRVDAVNRVAARIHSEWQPGDSKVGVVEAIRDDEARERTGIGYRPHFEQPTLNLVNAFLFPFRNVQDSWRLFPLAVLLTVLPPVGVMLARGWRLDVVRRLGAGDAEPIPRLRETGRHFGAGIMLALLRLLFWVPAVALLVLFGAVAFWEFVVASFRWLVHAVFGWGDPLTLAELGREFLIPAVLHSLAPISYLVVAWPIYRACVIRYALTGKSSALFDIPKAVGLVVRHLDSFLLLFAFWALAQAAFLSASLPLMATGVGVLGVSGFLAPLHYCMTAYLYGAAAVRIRETMARDGTPERVDVDTRDAAPLRP